MNANAMESWSSFMVLFLLVAGQQHLANGMNERDVERHRLPMHVKPLLYVLELELDARKKGFSGKVEIKLSFKGETDSEDFSGARSTTPRPHPYATERRIVTMNAEGLLVHEVNFRYFYKGKILSKVRHEAKNKMLVIELGEDVNFKRFVWLSIRFEGTVQTEAKGLFRSYFQNSQTLATHFKPNYARRVFPCFDEPEFKAKFKMIIIHPLGTTALSNMPAIEVMGTLKNGLRTIFELTPEMSSYLLSLAVGKFSTSTKSSEKDKMPITFHVPPGMMPPSDPPGPMGGAPKMLTKAVRAYERVLKFFEGIEHPLKKIDIVAVDMNIGAMESWGLVTIKWNLLCTQEELLKPEDQIYAVTAITNMMVRLWLGNLVTVSWWDDLWFIEGLASYVTNELIEELFPELDSKMYRLMDTTYSAMIDDDDPRKTHPIQCDDPQTIEAIQKWYDSLTCKKSEAIIRMFAHFLGKHRFEFAIRETIKSKTKEGQIEVDEFWSSLAVGNFRTHENIHLWTQKAGYPIIFVSITSEGRLLARQESNMENGNVWPVPVTYEVHHVTEGSKNGGRFVLTDLQQKEVSLHHSFSLSSLKKGDQWLKLNPKYEGYYRVVYKSPELLEALVRAVDSGRMPAVDRFQLLSDAYAYAKRAGLMNDVRTLLELYSKDTDDGVVLLLTTLLIDSCNNGWPVPVVLHHVFDLMMNYYDLNGRLSGAADSNVLKQYTRGRVLYFLVAYLRDKDVVEEVRNYRAIANRLPPFFELVDEYMSAAQPIHCWL